MKNILFYVCIFCALKANAQPYHITFAGTGLSASVSTVKIENLTSGTSLIINGSDILSLTSTITGINTIEKSQSSRLIIFPNPMIDNAKMEIYSPSAGDAIISIIDLNGTSVAQVQCYLDKGREGFKLSGISNGLYIISVKGNNYQFSGRLVSNGKYNRTIKIEKENSALKEVSENTKKLDRKGTLAAIEMLYNPGDRLKFTGIAGSYSTIKTDIPTSDKTITFNFIECKDGDNNNYPVVEIGTQIWMAENLKTTTLNNVTTIPHVTDGEIWSGLSTSGYCWFNNDATAYKVTFGGLYNWYTVNTGRLCPAGWHVPSDTEWTVLTDHLGGQNVAGGKLKETGIARWNNPNTGATNETGFTALPGGDRSNSAEFSSNGIDGTFWSSSEENDDNAWFRSMNFSAGSTNRNYYYKKDGFSVRCLKGVVVELANVTTSPVSSVGISAATAGGNVTSDGGDVVTARGVCWSISPNPTILNNKTINGSGTGSFTSAISGLTAGTTYYVRSYATNIAGTKYGKQVSFNTKVADIDGNTYKTVTIGTQVWLAENLKTTKYNNGENIPLVSNSDTWYHLKTPAYCWYDNSEADYKAMYGALYNWYSVNTGRLCMEGWHVPSTSEWSTLTDYLGGESVAGGKLSEVGSDHWLMTNPDATNESGFTALPGGRNTITYGTPSVPISKFDLIGAMGYWWSSTLDNVNAWYRSISNQKSITNFTASTRQGFSVRCLKGVVNVLPVLTTASISSVTLTSAASGGNVASDGGAAITARGICWNTSVNPTIANSSTSDGNGTGSFTSALTALQPGTTYYVRAYAINSVGIAYGNEVSFTTDQLIIGQAYQGGIIAYILQPGDPGYIVGQTHGLIAAPNDLGLAVWGCYGTVIPGADGTAIGTGYQNTLDIMNGCSPINIAAALCGNLNLGGYDDWFLPSIDELEKVYLNRTVIGNFETNYYWSSTEVSNSNAALKSFDNIVPRIVYKASSAYVRAIRAF